MIVASSSLRETSAITSLSVDLPTTPPEAFTKEGYAVLEVGEPIPYAVTGQHGTPLAQSLPNGRLLFTKNSHTTPNNLWLLSGLYMPDEPPKLKQNQLLHRD